MTALSDVELERIGYGTAKHPHVSVHFDLFPYVYFGETSHRVGTTIDEKGGTVRPNMESAKEYALKHFDELMEIEIQKMESFKSRIPNAPLDKRLSETGTRIW